MHALFAASASAVPLPVSKVAAGEAHTCAISSGAASCWGAGNDGQLGYGGTAHQQTPREVINLGAGVVDIDAGFWHSCAVTAAGAVKCWGAGTEGKLGNGSANTFDSPQQVSGLTSGATQVAVGNVHSCALVSGKVYCWGSGQEGRIGNGSDTQQDTPVELTALGSGVTAIAAGSKHTCALISGAVKCWGDAGFAQLGNGGYADQNLPVDVSGLSGVTSITAGSFATCAIASGAVKCWGRNNDGALGLGDENAASTPRQVLGLTSDVSSVTYGGWFGCAVQLGATKCWGDNQFGQLGRGTSGEVSLLALGDVVGLPNNVSQLSAGEQHVCAVASGYGYCWGDAEEGQLGNGVIDSESPFEPIPTPTPQEVFASFTPPGGLGSGPVFGGDPGGGPGGGNPAGVPPNFKSPPKSAKPGRAVKLKTRCVSTCTLTPSLKIGKKKIKGLKKVKIKAGERTTNFKLPSKVVKQIKTGLKKKKDLKVVLTLILESVEGRAKALNVRIK